MGGTLRFNPRENTGKFESDRDTNIQKMVYETGEGWVFV